MKVLIGFIIGFGVGVYRDKVKEMFLKLVDFIKSKVSKKEQ
jgi:ABC-type dipeptide/oligopeptide/nickel transport system permease subunit